MKRILTILFLLFALISCKDDITRMNKRNLIPREKFVNILVDMHLTDVITSGNSYYRRYEPGDSLDLYNAIFEKYHTSKSMFDSTVSMYTRRPDVYLKVYDEVLLKLNYILDTLKKNTPKFSKELIEE
jgi:hypothetical protein